MLRTALLLLTSYDFSPNYLVDTTMPSPSICSAPEPSSEAGAPAEDEIEVTPEMIEAGVDVLWKSGSVEIPMDGVDQALVQKIFSAMLRARPTYRS